MQTLNRLLTITRAASAITDLARAKHTYTLPVMHTAETLYIHADEVAVRLVRWERPQVELTVETSPPLAWRTATDYDEHGVYVVVIPRLAAGALTKAVMDVLLPSMLHVTLRMRGGLVSIDHINGTLHLPPVDPAPPALPPKI